MNSGLATALKRIKFRLMAVWQFVCDLLPSSAARIDGVIAARMSREQLDGIELAFSPSAASAIFERVCLLLPEKQSWYPDLRIWGDEKTDDVQIGVREAQIEGVQFRLNVADLRMPLVGDICLLARDFECVLATRGGAILRPYSESVVRAIMQSDAACYVRNPEGYLREAIQRDPETK
ncbi:hypothetical protein ACXHMN_05145 [Rhizobium sp. LEGMi12c]